MTAKMPWTQRHKKTGDIGNTKRTGRRERKETNVGMMRMRMTMRMTTRTVNSEKEEGGRRSLGEIVRGREAET